MSNAAPPKPRAPKPPQNGTAPNGGGNNGNGEDRGFRKRTMQAVGLVVGVGGLILDYGREALFAAPPGDHVPVWIYLLFIGMAWGTKPELWLGSVVKLLSGVRQLKEDAGNPQGKEGGGT